MSEAAASGSDRCPRCGGNFHCGMQDAAPCPCTTLALSAALQASLQQRYTGCLCLRCLRALAADAAAAAPDQSLRSTTLPTE